MTDTPGAVTSFVARPAANRRAASGGSSGSTSSRCRGSTPSTPASRGMKRGRGRSSPVSQTRIRAGLESCSLVANSSLLRPTASRAACRRSPRSSGRATAAPHHAIGGHTPVAPNPSARARLDRATASSSARQCVDVVRPRIPGAPTGGRAAAAIPAAPNAPGVRRAFRFHRRTAAAGITAGAQRLRRETGDELENYVLDGVDTHDTGVVSACVVTTRPSSRASKTAGRPEQPTEDSWP